MDKTLIAQTVANKLFATEDSVDQAIIEASKLMTGLIEARQEMRLSAVVGGGAVAKIAAALSALSEARKAMVEAHQELDETTLRIGIRNRVIGVTDKGSSFFEQQSVGHRKAS